MFQSLDDGDTRSQAPSSRVQRSARLPARTPREEGGGEAGAGGGVLPCALSPPPPSSSLFSVCATLCALSRWSLCVCDIGEALSARFAGRRETWGFVVVCREPKAARLRERADAPHNADRAWTCGGARCCGSVTCVLASAQSSMRNQRPHTKQTLIILSCCLQLAYSLFVFFCWY